MHQVITSILCICCFEIVKCSLFVKNIRPLRTELGNYFITSKFVKDEIQCATTCETTQNCKSFHYKKKDCYNGSTENYKGTMNTTIIGRVCQAWASQEPNEHSYTDFIDGSPLDARNYCRDPANNGYLWCYTVDPVSWDHCDIPNCDDGVHVDHCYDTDSPSSYMGTWNKTVNGIPCQRWDSQEPHSHSYTDSLGQASNYCRDPDDKGYLWCYTIDENIRWNSCGINTCKGSPVDHCYDTGSHRSYIGKWNKTINGIPCQRWDSKTPHNHSNTDPADYPDTTIAEASNYCRDPDDEGFLWCYTMNENIRWNSCGISTCFPVEECYDTKSHKNYMGSWSKTISGIPCQRWDSQEPHGHSNTDPTAFPDTTITEASNYCRDPDDEGYLWCYTMDTNIRYASCGIKKCTAVLVDHCYENHSHRSYMGTWSKTINGISCQRWDSQTPHGHSYTDPAYYPDASLGEASNYCRDPDGKGFLWCYTMDENIIWKSCGINRCTEKCYDTDSHKSYMGKWNKTINGTPCQRWDSHAPHDHSNKDPAEFPDTTITEASNYCRDPDDEGYLWCYTMDTNVRYAPCGINKCIGFTPCRPDANVAQYEGTWSTTYTGRTCQRWDTQDPHSHEYSDDSYFIYTVYEAHNYCRDPDNSGVLWCYTSDPAVEWELCDIPECYYGMADHNCWLYNGIANTSYPEGTSMGYKYYRIQN